VNVSQFADPYAEYRLADDPKFKQWADRSGEHVYLKYLITHPITTVFQPIVNAPQLLTMNPDYISTPGLPSWASTVVYGNLSSLATPNAPSGAPRSSDPLYVVALFGVGSFLFCVAVVRHRSTRVIWVAAAALLFAGVWAIAIWSFAATELPREFIETAVLFHVSMILLIAATLDSLISGVSQTGEHQGSRKAMSGAFPAPIHRAESSVETSSASHKSFYVDTARHGSRPGRARLGRLPHRDIAADLQPALRQGFRMTWPVLCVSFICRLYCRSAT
jgi:hypothetical protein